VEFRGSGGSSESGGSQAAEAVEETDEAEALFPGIRRAPESAAAVNHASILYFRKVPVNRRGRVAADRGIPELTAVFRV
jgi:hypothetical protein